MSYLETLQLTHAERNILIDLMLKDQKELKEMIEQTKERASANVM